LRDNERAGAGLLAAIEKNGTAWQLDGGMCDAFENEALSIHDGVMGVHQVAPLIMK